MGWPWTGWIERRFELLGVDHEIRRWERRAGGEGEVRREGKGDGGEREGGEREGRMGRRLLQTGLLAKPARAIIFLPQTLRVDKLAGAPRGWSAARERGDG